MNNVMYLPCGGVAEFDHGSGCSYRCQHCMATVGSMGQPRRCREEAEKWAAYERAGMWRWDYSKGKSYALDSKCKSQ